MLTRITVDEASRQLGINPHTLRAWMKQGRLRIGDTFNGGEGKRVTFVIYQEWLDAYKERGNGGA